VVIIRHKIERKLIFYFYLFGSSIKKIKESKLGEERRKLSKLGLSRQLLRRPRLHYASR
jgi:hypothetical protein